MSYDVTSTRMLHGSLRVRRETYLAWQARADELPECHPFDDDLEEDEELVELPYLDWYGEGSGYAYRKTLGKVAADLEGDAEVLFTWEGGDRILIVHFSEGKATEYNVKFTRSNKLRDL